MRRARFKDTESHPLAYSHCVSCIVNCDFVLGVAEKPQLSMSNHFHLLVEVPQCPADEALPDDEGLIAHVQKCLGKKAATSLRLGAGALSWSGQRCGCRGFAAELVRSDVGHQPVYEGVEAAILPSLRSRHASWKLLLRSFVFKSGIAAGVPSGSTSATIVVALCGKTGLRVFWWRAKGRL